MIYIAVQNFLTISKQNKIYNYLTIHVLSNCLVQVLLYSVSEYESFIVQDRSLNPFPPKNKPRQITKQDKNIQLSKQ